MKKNFVKKPWQIANIKIAGQKLAIVKQLAYDLLVENANLAEVDKQIHQKILELGAKPAFLNYQGFPCVSCISVNEELIHGIPRKYLLKKGDLVSFDVGLVYKNMYVDSAFSKSIGKNLENEKLIAIAKNAFYEGLKFCSPKFRIGDIEHAIGFYIQKKGMFTTMNYCGHGIGKKLHEEPYIFNSGLPNTKEKIVNGMVFCIEPMILQQSGKTFVKPDKWTVCAQSMKKAAHYEQTILIENDKPIILTGELI